MKKLLCLTALAIAALFIPYPTSAGIQDRQSADASASARHIQKHTAPTKTAVRLVETISQLEKKLAIARGKLAEEMRAHPDHTVPLAIAPKRKKPALISFTSATLEVTRGPSDNVAVGDTILVIRRDHSVLSIVANGFVSQVTPDCFNIKLEHCSGRIFPADEVYIVNNPTSPFWIGNLQFDSLDGSVSE